MRSFAALLCVAVSSVSALDNWQDYQWSWTPDLPAAWYKANGEPLPEVAPDITVVEANKSFVVKLECVGCPFRVRELHEVVETWQEPPQVNSLLLNFTIDDNEPGLLLNGEQIAPLAPMPLAISAFQTPANLSTNTMANMTRMQMLDSSWLPGTKYGQFELQYEHALVGTRTHGRNWIQLDVVAVHQRSVHNPRSAALDKEGQKMVQVALRRKAASDRVFIEDIQVVERKDRVQPYRMNCGRYAIIKSEYNPLEWDYYGKFGTVERAWHRFFWGIGEFLDRNGLYVILATVGFAIYSVVRWAKRRQQAQTVSQIKEDAEAALLEPDYEDRPPEYSDIPEIKVEDFDDARNGA